MRGAVEAEEERDYSPRTDISFAPTRAYIDHAGEAKAEKEVASFAAPTWLQTLRPANMELPVVREDANPLLEGEASSDIDDLHERKAKKALIISGALMGAGALLSVLVLYRLGYLSNAGT